MFTYALVLSLHRRVIFFINGSSEAAGNNIYIRNDSLGNLSTPFDVSSKTRIRIRTLTRSIILYILSIYPFFLLCLYA